jgi:uncharacterized protein (DUF885 family)
LERSSKHGPRIDEGILSDEQAEARSEIARFISPSVFPATSAEIRESAQSNNAPTAVVEALERLPEGQTYENFQAVWEALGGREEKRF